jgi:hypothetical protein
MQQQRQRFGHGKGSYRGDIGMQTPVQRRMGDTVQRRNNLPRRGKTRMIGAGGEPHTEGRSGQDLSRGKVAVVVRDWDWDKVRGVERDT